MRECRLPLLPTLLVLQAAAEGLKVMRMWTTTAWTVKMTQLGTSQRGHLLLPL